MAINNPFANLGRFFGPPAPVDLSGLFQPTPYPVNPLVLLMQGAAAVKRARQFEAERLAEREEEKRRREEERAFRELQKQQLEFNVQQAKEAAGRRPQEQARADLQALVQTYGFQQIAATPALLQRFLQLNAAAGNPIPTERIQQMMGVQIGTQRPEEGGLGRFLAPAGQQTVQVPTGEMVERPVVPVAPPEPPQRVAFMNTRTGQIQMVEFPAGTRVETFTPPGEPTRHVIVDRNGRVVQVLPPGLVPHTLPAPPSGPADTSGLSPSQKRLVDSYNKLVDQRTRLLDIASQAFDEGTRDRALADIAAIDQRIGQLQPQIDAIYGIQRPGGGPQPSPGNAPPLDPKAHAGKYIQNPQTGEVWYSDGTKWTKQGAQPPAGQPTKPAPTVTSDVSNMIRTLATSLQRQKVPWNVARLRILRQLSARGMNVGDPKLIAAVDAVRY